MAKTLAWLERLLEMLQPSSWARAACASRLAHGTATDIQGRFPLATRAYRTLQEMRLRFHAGGSSLDHPLTFVAAGGKLSGGPSTAQ